MRGPFLPLFDALAEPVVVEAAGPTHERTEEP
jgi:hypothetical protein